MSKGGGSGSSMQTQQAQPWSGQAPYLQNLYRRADRLPVQRYYPGQTVADQAPETIEGLGDQADTARARQQMLQGTLQGDYLYGGAGFDRAMEAAHNQIAPMVQGQFASGGRYGGGLAQEAETSALADAFAGLYGQERQRQMAAAAGTPSLTDIGAQREAYEQALLSDQLNRWNFRQQAPYNRLAAQSAVIQGGFPGGSSSTRTIGPPPQFGDPQHMMTAAFPLTPNWFDQVERDIGY